MNGHIPVKRTTDSEGEIVWTPLELGDSKEIKIERKEFDVDDAVKHKHHYLLYGVLSAKECQDLIDQTEKIGYTSLEGVYSSGYRSNWRVIVHDEPSAEVIYKRCEALFPERITVQDAIYERSGLNGRWRFCRYTEGQKFETHVDAGYAPRWEVGKPREGSILTFMLYLNDVDDGGATRFVNSRNKNRVINAAIQPRAGMAMVFDHNMLHDGEILKSGKKWIMRSEVMYRECGKVERAAKPPVKQQPPQPVAPPKRAAGAATAIPVVASASLSSANRSDDVATTTPVAGPSAADGSPSLL